MFSIVIKANLNPRPAGPATMQQIKRYFGESSSISSSSYISLSWFVYSSSYKTFSIIDQLWDETLDYLKVISADN